ncbi:cation-translocating P-type ATPase [Candidatus Phytoplasma australiense]|uniref:Cation-transporting ATPase pacL n=1 Tax=Strawberry lethal yellows phytoplasma (CPA) str. NZSb11 TaxID=980422 RepID=R4S043_PHYAS|nr:cation-transporting P-type ATPase [Candidatus Phytoplasma australiense]AGL90118.1 Cation-transporting ATPase pacL [Strawberry lethal yellows phytoplasma (CPA) str. NZSb11]
MKNIFSQQTLKELQAFFKTDLQQGLKSEEALQRLKLYGKNQIIINNQTTLFQQLKRELKDFLVILLLGAAFINFTIGIWKNNFEEIFEGVFILIIVLGNIFISIYYENKTKKTLALVEQKTSLKVKVIRDNSYFLIPMENLVPGDLVILEAGDIVAADIRLIETFNLLVDESILTGESKAVLKNSHAAKNNDQNILSLLNMVFMNTIVLKGRARGVVVACGMKTEMGKITNFVDQAKSQKTPLEQKLTRFIKGITLLIVLIIMINALFVLLKNNNYIDFNILKNTFLEAIALGVAAIPEGLLIIMTLILALGMKKLTTQKAIVKNLKTLEILGAVNVVCTDKTGTLTQNKMVVKEIILSQNQFQPFVCRNENEKNENNPKKNPTEINLNNENNFALQKLLLFGVLCNDALISDQNEQKTLEIIADPTEKALINLALIYQINIQEIKKNYFRIGEIPFDSQRKMMTTFCSSEKDQVIYQITKGAPEVVLQRCTHIEDQGQIIKKTPAIQKILETQINQLTQKSLRVLAIAYKNCAFDNPNIINTTDQKEQNLIFLGAVALQDPIRDDVYQAIINCQKAHVAPIMITGDHLQTATTIAKNLKILQNKNDLVITGEALNQMSETEFFKKLNQIKVYARTNHHDKLKIVQAWQKKGFVVAMTGDGVNDALSIKQADVGIAMGIAGSNVAKMAADMILTDDNFATIVTSLESGRHIFNNIKKSLIFLLSCNMGEIMLILLHNFFGSFLIPFTSHTSHFQILTAFQILWVNLVTDSLVAMALGLESQEKNNSPQKPYSLHENFLNKKTYQKIIIEGLLIALLAFIAGCVGYHIHKEKTLQEKHLTFQTFAFMVLAITQLIHVWNLRSFTTSTFKLKRNPLLIKTFCISLFCQLSIIWVPAIRKLFKLISLSLLDFAIIFFFSIIPLVIIEIKKALNATKKSKNN